MPCNPNVKAKTARPTKTNPSRQPSAEYLAIAQHLAAIHKTLLLLAALLILHATNHTPTEQREPLAEQAALRGMAKSSEHHKPPKEAPQTLRRQANRAGTKRR